MHDVFRPSVGPGRGLQPWSSRRGLDSGAGEREIVTPLGGHGVSSPSREPGPGSRQL